MYPSNGLHNNASYSHLRIIKHQHIIQSMSNKGDCWDNAVAESFFHTLNTYTRANTSV